METLFYNDCNNNAEFLSELITDIKEGNLAVKNWEVSALDVLTKMQEDYCGTGGTICQDIDNVYLFNEKVIKEHYVVVTSDELIGHLKNIKSVYEGQFRAIGTNIKIIVYDGDIFELYGVPRQIINEMLLRQKCKLI